ncbi:MAG: cation transporter [Candidatus Marinimicrobia bacterium]|nr:cation transporter [Candidatus Neomarinimicrobiota bacterium]MCH7954248.1 cation transporter [Candidatus Neomarinimicrobiota bacterium]
MDSRIQIQDGVREIKRLTYLGMIINVFLMVIKFFGGIFFGSISLIADAFHTFSDISTDILILWGVIIGSRPADSSHPFGHGKFETLSGTLLSVVLIVVGTGIVAESGRSVMSARFMNPGLPVLFIALISVIIKEYLYQLTIKSAKQLDSVALYANAWHHRSDALSSIVVIVGVISSMLGFLPGDSIAGLFVGLMIIIIGIKFLIKTGKELMEGSVEEDVLQSIKSILDEHPDVKSWHKLRTRKVGRELFVDVHILVEPELSVIKGHQIAEEVESIVKKAFTRPLNVLTHVEPDLPFARK